MSKQKKCLEAANAEGALAIAHDDDLQVIKHNDLVRPNKKQNSAQTRIVTVHEGNPHCRCSIEVIA